MANFHQSVPADLYEWLMEEQKKRKAGSIQETVREILREVKEEAEEHG